MFPNLIESDGYMVMLCYKNGSLTREGTCVSFFIVLQVCMPLCHYYIADDTYILVSDVRNRYADKSWDVFNNYLEKTPPLNG